MTVLKNCLDVLIGGETCSLCSLLLGLLGVLFSPMEGGWAGGEMAGKFFLGFISVTVSCRKLIVSRDIGYGL